MPLRQLDDSCAVAMGASTVTAMIAQTTAQAVFIRLDIEKPPDNAARFAPRTDVVY
jgi:hypothetical protein